MPNVSVIIPNYNHARFLPERIESVLGQTYRDFDVLILDDASADGSRGIMERYADDDRVTVNVNRENSGSAFRQWRKGVHMTRGQYVWIAESDDIAEASFLDTMVRILETHPAAGLAYCRSGRIDEEGNRLPDPSPRGDEYELDRWLADFTNNGRDECARHLVRRNTIPNASAVVFRREVYERAGGTDPSMILCGDWMTWARMAAVSDVAYTARALNRFRVHTASVRHAAAGGVAGLCERLRVQSFILRNIAVPASVKAAVCKDLRRTWYGMRMDPGSTLGFRDDVRILAAAWHVDLRQAMSTFREIVSDRAWARWKRVKRDNNDA